MLMKRLKWLRNREKVLAMIHYLLIIIESFQIWIITFCNSHMVKDGEDDTKEHLTYAEDDSQFHLV